jgi:hypothetical protein
MLPLRSGCSHLNQRADGDEKHTELPWRSIKADCQQRLNGKFLGEVGSNANGP